MSHSIEIEEQEKSYPELEIARWRFLLSLPDSLFPDKAALRKKLKAKIEENEMAPFYAIVAEETGIGMDKNLYETLKKKNQEKLKQLDNAIEDAKENLGESEVREAFLAKADYYNSIGEKDLAVKQYHLTLEKTIGSGQKIDIVFTLIRIGLFWMDHELTSRNIEKALSMEEGSDWDRKNRLKVYQAVYLMSIRNFKKSASLFLDTISTFTATELLDYKTYIFYTVLMGIVSLDRVTLKKKIIDAPEILQVIDEIPHLSPLLNSLYECDYEKFFLALASITDNLKVNYYLSPHAGYFCKEMRVIAYLQMLESYRSVQLDNMANAFGVSVEFLDHELSRFIASGRLHCKIDKVGGIVETNRPDSKNAQYQATIKQGDLLLNRIQKLSRVINLG